MEEIASGNTLHLQIPLFLPRQIVWNGAEAPVRPCDDEVMSMIGDKTTLMLAHNDGDTSVPLQSEISPKGPGIL